MLEHGFDNFYMELIENHSCDSKEELRAKEGEWIRKIGTLNVGIAGRTGQQYRADNAEYFANKSNKYYHEHHDERLQKIKCDNCGCAVSRVGMARHRKTSKCTNHINM